MMFIPWTNLDNTAYAVIIIVYYEKNDFLVKVLCGLINNYVNGA